MGNTLMQWASTVAVEVAHLGTDGVMHGHSLLLEAWTDQRTCLDAWKARLSRVADEITGELERTIGARTFEDVGVFVLASVPECTRVIVRLPTKGHLVEVIR